MTRSVLRVSFALLLTIVAFCQPALSAGSHRDSHHRRNHADSTRDIIVDDLGWLRPPANSSDEGISIGPWHVAYQHLRDWVEYQTKIGPSVLARIKQITFNEPQKKPELAASLLTVIYGPSANPTGALRDLQRDQVSTDSILSTLIAESDKQGAVLHSQPHGSIDWKSLAYGFRGEQGVSKAAWRFASNGSRLDLVVAITSREAWNDSAAAQAAVLSDGELSQVRKDFFEVIATDGNKARQLAEPEGLGIHTPANDNSDNLLSENAIPDLPTSTARHRPDERRSAGPSATGTSNSHGGVDAVGNSGVDGDTFDRDEGDGAEHRRIPNARAVQHASATLVDIFLLTASCASTWVSQADTVSAVIDGHDVVVGNFASDSFIVTDREQAVRIIEAHARSSVEFRLYTGCVSHNIAHVKAPVRVRANRDERADTTCRGRYTAAHLRPTTPAQICVLGRGTVKAFAVRPQEAQTTASGASRVQH